MEEDAIVPSHHCILLIHVMTFIDEDLCIITSKTLCTEEDPHQGSKFKEQFVYVTCYLCIKYLFDNSYTMIYRSNNCVRKGNLY